MNDSGPRSWHCDDEVLTAFVEGTVGPVSGASAETHLMSCSECRERVSRLSSTDLLDGVWARVRESVEAPSPGLVERLLLRWGMSSETARLLAAVPAMRGAWLLGIVGATIFAAVSSAVSDSMGMAVFLVIAPLAPLAGVAASFGGDADPAHDLVVSSPYSALRLLLLRTVGVLAASAPVTVLVGLALPGSSWLSVAWLAPAAAVVSLTLAFGPLLGHTASASVVGAVWTVTVMSALRWQTLVILVQPAAQAAFLVLAVAGAVRITIHYRALGHTWRTT
jgi:hypothetical protein